MYYQLTKCLDVTQRTHYRLHTYTMYSTVKCMNCSRVKLSQMEQECFFTNLLCHCPSWKCFLIQGQRLAAPPLLSKAVGVEFMKRPTFHTNTYFIPIESFGCEHITRAIYTRKWCRIVHEHKDWDTPLGGEKQDYILFVSVFYVKYDL